MVHDDKTARRAEPTPREGDTLVVEIDALDDDGHGTAPLGARHVVVPGAVPGDRVEARVVSVARGRPLVFAHLLRVLVHGPARVLAPCRHDVARGGYCTGCPLSSLGLEAQRADKRARLEATLGLAVPPLVGGEGLGYRWSAKRVAFTTRAGLTLGSFTRGSHRGASMRDCLVDHPRLREAAALIEDRARELGVVAVGSTASAETSAPSAASAAPAEGSASPAEPALPPAPAGGLAAVWLKTDGEQVAVALVGDAEEPTLRALAEALPFACVVLAARRPAGNDLRGLAPVVVKGPETLAVQVAGVTVEVPPLGFLQPNPEVLAQAYRDLVAGFGAGATGLDLYAGSGVTTALLRAAGAEVVPCESHPESARSLGVAPSTAEATLAAVSLDRAPTFVVANPPRAGLGAAVVAELVRLAPAELAVMSCGPEGLARDLTGLAAAGYRVVSVHAYDTLPQTPHVEVVVRLRRTDPPR